MHPPLRRHEVYRAFYWYGDGLAYNYTLLSLRRKLENLWGLVGADGGP